MKHLLPHYIKNLKNNGSTKNTVKNYASDVKKFIEWAEGKGISPNSLSKDVLKQFETYLEGTNYSDASKRRILSSSNSFIEWSIEDRLMKEVAGPFLESLKKDNAAKNTVKNYSADISKFFSWVLRQSDYSKHPKNITPHELKDFKKYINSTSLNESTKRRILTSVTSFVQWASVQGLIFTGVGTKLNFNYKKFVKPRLTFEKLLYTFALFIILGAFSLFYPNINYFVNNYIAPKWDLLASIETGDVLGTSPPSFLSYQGRLLDNNGNPITSSSDFVFKIFDAETGGTELYNTGTCSITPDQDGIFDTTIGSSCGAAIDSSVFGDNQTTYLEVTIETETLSPRQPISSVPYALNTDTLDGVDSTEFLRSDTSDTFEGSFDQTLTLSSALTGNRASNLLSISQSNDASFAMSVPLVLISQEDIDSSGSAFELTNLGTGNAFVINDESSDTSPFVVDSDGNVSIGSTSTSSTLGILNTSDQTGFTLEANATQNSNIFQINSSGGSGGDLFVIDGAGNVGIGGVTSPGSFLDLPGATSSQSTVRVRTGSEPSSPNTGDIYSNGSNIYFYDGSSWIDLTEGSGGTGSTRWNNLLDPDGNLSLGMSTNTTTFTWATGTGSSDLFSLTTDASSDGTGNLLNLQTGASSTVNPFRVSAGGTEALFVDDTANVGIGSTSPGRPLDIVRDQDGATTLGLTNNTAGTSASVQFIASSNSSSGFFGAFDDSHSITAYQDRTVFGANSGSSGVVISAPSTGHDIRFIAGTSSSDERMRITNDGNVGIGTTGPGASLHVGSGGTLDNVGSDDVYIQNDLEVDGTIYGNVSGNINTSFSEGSVVFADSSGDLAEDNANFFWDDTSDNLGIGTASPAGILDIVGDSKTIYFQPADVTADGGTKSSSTLTLRGKYDSDGSASVVSSNYDSTIQHIIESATPESRLALSINSSELFSIKESGNVGINTTAPDARLEVITSSANDDDVGLRITPGNSSERAIIALDRSPVNSRISTTANFLAFGTDSNLDQMVFRQGNLGIGVTGPSARLHSQIDSTAVTATMYTGYFENLATNTTTDGVDKYGTYITSTGDFSGSTGTATNNWGLYVDTVSGADNNYGAYFAQNVGVGTTDPVEKLDIDGNLATQNKGQVRYYSGGSEFYQMGISGSDGFQFMDKGATGGVLASKFVLVSQGGSAVSEWDFATGDFQTDGTLSVDGSGDSYLQGNVGIGTTGPGALLHVGSGGTLDNVGAGDAYVQNDLEVDGTIYGNVNGTISPNFTEGSVVFADANGDLAEDNTNFFWDDSMDRLGINTTSPSAALDVNGNFTVTTAGAVTGTSLSDGTTTFSGSSWTSTGDISWDLPSSTTALNVESGLLNLDTSNSRVGIGTTSPLAQLNVLGTGTQLRLSYDASNYFDFQVDSTGKITLSDSGTQTATFSAGGNTMDVPTTFTSAGDVSIANDLQFTNQTASYIKSNAPLYIQAGESHESNDLTLQTYNSGNIVLDLQGTGYQQLAGTDPSIVFDTTTSGDTDYWMGVIEDGAGDDNDTFSIGDGSTPGSNRFLTLDTDGNVGVGTTGPSEKLEVSGGAFKLTTAGNDTSFAIHEGGTGNDITHSMWTATNGGYTEIYDGAGTANVHLDGRSSQNSWLTAGNLGIGTTDPGALLHVGSGGTLDNVGANDVYIQNDLEVDGTIYGDVSGNINTNLTEGSVVFADANGDLAEDNANFFWDDSTDRLGIGTSSPVSDVTLGGDRLITTAGANTLNFQTSSSASNSFYYVMPKGSPASGYTEISAFSTDFIANTTDWERITMKKAPDGKGVIETTAAGTGTVRSLQLRTGTNTGIVIDNTGNVGIGTTGPGEIFEVVKNADATTTLGQFLNNSTGTSAHTRLIVGQDSSTQSLALGYFGSGFTTAGTNIANSALLASRAGATGGLVLRTDATAPIIFATDGSANERMRIASNGNVGIGTTNPQFKLEVNGGISVTSCTGCDPVWTTNGSDIYYDTGNVAIGTSSTPANTLEVSGDGFHGVAVSSYGSTGRARFLGRRARGTEASPSALQAGDDLLELGVNGYHSGGAFSGTHAHMIVKAAENWTSSVHDTDLIFRTASGTSTGERMRIASDGNVGIGTTDPTSNLHIDFGSGFGDVRAGLGTSGAGFGDANTSFLRVTGGTDANDYASALWLRNEASNIDWGIWMDPTNDKLHFTKDADTRMTILTDGNVGIGTTGPGKLLDVAGIARAQKYESDGTNVETVSGTYSATKMVYQFNEARGIGYNRADDRIYFAMNEGVPMVIDNGGNVGIGTTDPGMPLHLTTTQNDAVEFENTSSWMGMHLTGASGFDSNIYFREANTEQMLIGWTASASHLRFRDMVGGVDRMVIEQGGSVGIGTTSPTADLHIGGSSTTSDGSPNVPGVQISGGTGGWGKLELAGGASNTGGHIDFMRFENLGGDYDARLITRPSFFGMGVSGDEDNIAINLSSGNVGIGTTSPSGSLKLDVAGQVGATGYCDQNGDNCKSITSIAHAGGNPGSEYLLNLESDHLTADEIAAAMGTSSSGISKCDDSTAPAPGCFEINGYKPVIGSHFWKVDQESEYFFEVWVKVQDGGGDNDERFYAGWEMHDSSKTSFGNTQRYWGSLAQQFDENSRNDGNWYLVRGRIAGVGGAHGNFINGTEYARLVLLMNYSSGNAVTRYAGMKLYRSRSTITSLYTMNTNRSVDNDDSSRKLVIDSSGNVTPNNLQASGSGPHYFSSGNVGIGSTSPNEALDVVGNADISGYLDFGSDTRQMINLWGGGPNANYGIGIQGSTQYFRTGTHFAWYEDGTHSDSTFNPGTGGNVQMVLESPGNLGIGTTDPSQRLQVAGNILTHDGIYYLDDTAGGTYGMGYSTEGGSQMTLFSDDLIEFTESDANTVRASWSMNSATFDFNGTVTADALSMDGNISMNGNNIQDTDYVTFQNHEHGDFNTDGLLYWDLSAGLYIKSSNSTNPQTGGSLLWSSENFTAGNQLSVSYDSEDEPTLSVVDGSGSGLDADLLDGRHGSGYLHYSEGGSLNVNGTPGKSQLYAGSTGSWTNRGPSGNNAGALFSINTHPGDYYSQIWFNTAGDTLYHRSMNNGGWRAWDEIWTSGSDGSGSGLDADTLDSLNSSQFLRSDTSDTFTGGTLTLTNNADAPMLRLTRSDGAYQGLSIDMDDDSVNNEYALRIRSQDGGTWTSSDTNFMVRADEAATYAGFGTEGVEGPRYGSGGTNVEIEAPDSQIAQLLLQGSSQGTGYLYVGQSSSHGGGITYSGDGTPTSPFCDDCVSIFRRSSSTDVSVVDWFHNSNTARFRGNIHMNNNIVHNINEVRFNNGGNHSIGSNSSGLLFDGGDGTLDFLVYDERAYVDNIRFGYLGTARIETYDTNESLTIAPNGSGEVDVQANLRFDSGLADGALNMNSQVINNLGRLNFASGEFIDDGTNLHLESNSGFIDFRPTDGTHGLIIRDFDGSSTAWSGIRTQDDGRMQLGADGANYNTTLDDSGNLGLGDATPDQKLDVVGSAQISGFVNARNGSIRMGGGTYNDGIYGTSNLHLETAGQMIFFTNGNNARMWINTSGNLGVNENTPARRLHVNGPARITGSVAVSDNRTLCTNATSGDIEFKSGACGTSSLRYKENIENIEYGLEDIRKLNPVFFNYLEDSEAPSDHSIKGNRTKRRVGFIAEEMVKTIPEVVVWEDGKVDSIDYSHLTALLARGIQEQQMQIESLDHTIQGITGIESYETLENNVFDLQAMIEELNTKINTGALSKKIDTGEEEFEPGTLLAYKGVDEYELANMNNSNLFAGIVKKVNNCHSEGGGTTTEESLCSEVEGITTDDSGLPQSTTTQSDSSASNLPDGSQVSNDPRESQLITYGQVKIKVTDITGEIKKGDLITISGTKEGHGEKHAGSGMIIGTALEDARYTEVVDQSTQDGTGLIQDETTGSSAENPPSEGGADSFDESGGVTSTDSEETTADDTETTQDTTTQDDQSEEASGSSAYSTGTVTINLVPQPKSTTTLANLEDTNLDAELKDVLSLKTDSTMQQFNNLTMTVEASLSVFGDANIAGNLTAKNMTATNKLNVGLISINSEDNSINSLASTLKLQNKQGAGDVEVFGGKLLLAKDGSIIALNKITADEVETKVLTINTTSQQVPPSTGGQGGVASTDPDETTTSDSTTNDQNNPAESGDPSGSIPRSSLGSATIEQGKTEVFIKTALVTQSSKIFVTPNTLELDSPIIVTEKREGEGFKVQIKTTAPQNIQFDWFIVQHVAQN